MKNKLDRPIYKLLNWKGIHHSTSVLIGLLLVCGPLQLVVSAFCLTFATFCMLVAIYLFETRDLK